MQVVIKFNLLLEIIKKIDERDDWVPEYGSKLALFFPEGKVFPDWAYLQLY